eukprot:TRINITY_DN1598_c0_g1_i1.p1 TRINITY_DN1598_c0_g1~~TRINITY_DN1598_c0_g1_i1.p1  ORF type:complete len:357 (-),score=199.85 TRINITY_DN1598_c0_g1_i1:850-1920(-)
MAPPEKVTIVGSGNWGSAIARIVGVNAAAHATFDDTVRMYVYEEEVEDPAQPGSKRKLSEVINTTHENVKYLPGVRLPENVVAVTDVAAACEGSTLLIFVLPHQFIGRLAKSLEGRLAPGARAISLIKGVDFDAEGNLRLISDMIRSELALPVSVLMGANVANEVALDQFCETTIGADNEADAATWKALFDRPTFRVSTVQDVAGVELCGALKNIVAIAAGICDGLDLGGNTKAAVMRIGLMEMKRFCQALYPNVPDQTFLESCGVADLITTCYGGRNRKCAEAHARTGKSFDELEVELLGGQKLQGTLTAKEIHTVLKNIDAVADYPLFHAVYRVAYDGLKPADMIAALGGSARL